MKAKKQEFNRPWVGLVKINTGSSSARLTSIDSYMDAKTQKKVNKFFAGNVPEIKIALADFPKESLRVVKPNMKEPKTFRVRLNSDCDTVESVTPVSGSYRVKLTELGPKTKDGDYKLIEKTFNAGTDKENSHQEFFALYEVLEGPFKGVLLPPYYLHYKFEGIPEDEDDGGFTRFNTADTPQASQLHRLQEWASVHGDILEEPIVWNDDDTILGELEERALDSDRELMVILDKGYIKSVSVFESYEDADEDDDVDTVFSKGDEDDVEEVEEVKPVKKASKPAPINKPKKVVKKSSDEDDDDL